MSKPKVTLTLLPHSDRSKKFVKKNVFCFQQQLRQLRPPLRSHRPRPPRLVLQQLPPNSYCHVYPNTDSYSDGYSYRDCHSHTDINSTSDSHTEV